MSALRAWLDVYGAFLRIAIAAELQYRAAGVIWLLGSIVEPLIYLVVWSTAARAAGGALEGFAPADFAAYYLVLMVVNQLTGSWLMHEMQWRIQNGSLSFLLLRPLHPVHSDLAENLAHKLVMLVVMLPAALLVGWGFAARFDTDARAVAAFVPAFAFAFALRFALEWVLALGAFWTTRVMAVNQAYFAVLFFLSGRAAPTELLPGPLEALAAALPFRWMVAFPVEVLLGRVALAELAAGFALQLTWLGLALAGSALLWRRAVRRFSAVGG
jgi:ABC-2 type transport system permease protein